MAKIKLIESLRGIKRTTIRYTGLKIRILLIDLVALMSIQQLIVFFFPLKDIFKPRPLFLWLVLNKYYLSNAVEI